MCCLRRGRVGDTQLRQWKGKHIITVTVTGEQLIDKRRGEVRLRKGGIPPVSIRMDPGVEEAL